MSSTVEIDLEMTVGPKNIPTCNAATRLHFVLQVSFVCSRVDAIRKRFESVTAYLVQRKKACYEEVRFNSTLVSLTHPCRQK